MLGAILGNTHTLPVSNIWKHLKMEDRKTILSFWDGPFVGAILVLGRVLLMEKSGEPVDMVNIPLFTGFHTSQVVLSLISEPSAGVAGSC